MAPRLSCINLQRGLLLPGFRRLGRPSRCWIVSGLLCWRDSHPLDWQLASLNGVAGFAAGGSSSERKRSRPIRAFSATPRDDQRPCRTLAEDPGRTQPRAAYPGAAAQTRVVSMAAIRLGSWESARAFKGIICGDISEFESHMPSHALSLWGLFEVETLPRQAGREKQGPPRRR
jgi:hypothetical protein